MGFHITRGPGVDIVAPGASELVTFVQKSEVRYSLFAKLNGHSESGESTSDNDDIQDRRSRRSHDVLFE